MPLQQKMKPLSFPLRWESTGDQWWYASPIDCAAANGHYDLVRELLYIDTNLLIKLTSLRRIRRLETVWEDDDNQVAKSRAYVAKNLLLECETESGHNSLIRAGYGGWLLYTAASAGELSFVQDLLERDPFLVFGEGEYGVTDILYAAARSKSSEVFKVLMDFAVGMKKFDEGNGKVGDEGEVFDGFRLEMINRGVHSAARGGNLEVLNELLLGFPDVLAFRDAQGSTILHSAAATGQDIVVKDLIASFSIIDSIDHQGNTSLHIAAYRGFLPVVETLLTASPSLASSTNNSGNTFLHMAVFGFQAPGFHRLDHQLELIRKLVKSKMIIVQDIINSRNNQGKTAFHLAAAENISLDVIELLMTVPSIDMKIKDCDGKTPIDILKHHPHSRSSRLLIKHTISAGGTVSYREDHAAVASHFKMQGGLGHSPGTSFRVADSEMFLYATNEDNDNDSDVESVGYSESSGEIISQCNSCSLSGIITNSRKPKNSASLNLKVLLQLPKRKNKESYDETPTSLRQRYSKNSSSPADNKKAIASPISCEIPSPIAKKKFRTSLSQGVLSQPRQNISSANSPACSKSSSPCSSDKSFDVRSGGKLIKPFNRGRSFFSKKSRVNRYLCFGAQGLPPVKDSVSCKRDSAGFLMPDSTAQVS